MKDYASFVIVAAVLLVLVYRFIIRPRKPRGKVADKKANHLAPDPHAWVLRAIKTDGPNSDGSSRNFLIESLNPLDTVYLQFNLEEKCYEIQTRRKQTLGLLPHSSSDKIRNYEAAGKIGKVTVKSKGGSVEHPELVIEIQVKP
jgi:hypothetical protein